MPRLHQPAAGSPPHTRGRYSPTTEAGAAHGFTPAYAGKIVYTVLSLPESRVHPRIRGEDRTGRGLSESHRGSPPHTRGRLRLATASSAGGRFTPAYAGKIFAHDRSRSGSLVHPRIRGEDAQYTATSTRISGSPPHTRGRFDVPPCLLGLAGFTPAYAGKINPRIRGEDQPPRTRGRCSQGSPPHTRGRF